MLPPIQVNGVSYRIPENNQDVMTLVNEAKSENKKISVRGSGHSFPVIEGAEAEGEGKVIYVMLSMLDQIIKWDIPNMRVTVQAGIHLGYDPFDPSGRSKSDYSNSLTYLIDQKKWAFNDLGGITHQTVGGFLATGSSGGSTLYAFEDHLVSVDVIICGSNGAEMVTYTRPGPDDPTNDFYAVGMANMGLMGVMVSATFQCVAQYNITGNETASYCDDCAIDLFGDGTKTHKPTLKAFLGPENNDFPYSRMFWWPQVGVRKSVVWKAAQLKVDPNTAFTRNPYREVPYIAGSPIPLTLGADVLFSAMGNWPTWLGVLEGENLEEYTKIKNRIELVFKPLIFPAICDVFVGSFKKNADGTHSNTVHPFSDYWYLGLPMDNQMGDKILPVWFTELWISIDQTQTVMNTLKNYYDGETGTGSGRTGDFCVEIYAAKKSAFWMSPAYQTDVVRIDILWFANNNNDVVNGKTKVENFYQQFWDLFLSKNINFRPHWGKYMPTNDWEVVDKKTYLERAYPKWTDWKNLRAKNDPGKIFVTDYWSARLPPLD